MSEEVNDFDNHTGRGKNIDNANNNDGNNFESAKVSTSYAVLIVVVVVSNHEQSPSWSFLCNSVKCKFGNLLTFCDIIMRNSYLCYLKLRWKATNK